MQKRLWQQKVRSPRCLHAVYGSVRGAEQEYKESVLPREVRRRVAVEALGSFGWDKYTGLDGKIIAMERFGASAPAGLLFKKFGFTVEHVVEVAKSLK